MSYVKVMNCVEESENTLQLRAIDHYRAAGYKLMKREWLVIAGDPSKGRGDLVFTKDGVDYVIECKRKPFKNVFEQAQFYAAAWKLRHARPRRHVVYGIWTCSQKEIIGEIRTKRLARQMCNRDACEVI